MRKHKKNPKKHASQIQPAGSPSSIISPWMPAGALLIAFAAFLAYLPSINGKFIWDDNLLIIENTITKAPDGLFRFWCSTEPFDYWPVTNTTFWIEWRLWGMNSTGYHVTNLILHIITSLLIWIILRKLSIPGAFLAAMIFTVHPINVESVAWIAERKDMLAMLFFILSIHCYLQAETQPSSQKHQYRLGVDFWYGLSLAGFVLGMLSKGSVAVLPVLLLGIIWWRRGVTKWDLVGTTPFFVAAVAFTEVNIWFQTHGTGEVIRTASFAERLLGAGGVVWFYLYKALLPFDLSFVYRQWHIQAVNPLWWLPFLAALIVTAVLWRYREGWSRPLLFAWGFFCVGLVPVMGFADTYFMKYSLVADHYQHIALVGVITLAAAGWSVWHQRARGAGHLSAIVLAILAVGALTFLTWRQSGLYRDELTLYKDILKKNPECWLANNNLGLVLYDTGQLQEAIKYYRQALNFKPDYYEAHNNLSVVLVQTGQTQEAIKHLQEALRLKPDYPEAHLNLGNVLHQTGRPGEAIEHYEQALRYKPDYADAHNNLGVALMETGQPRQAIKHYEQALTFKPDYSNAHNNLGQVLEAEGQHQQAIEHFKQALRFKPDYLNACYNLASAYAKINRSAEAISTAQKALELARVQGQTAQAKKIEEWLKSYRASLSDLPNTLPPSKSVPSPSP